jgi:2-dehydropantoate 2-reductase
MKIAIMGSGGVGGYFGGMLARAGEDVTFIARSEHLQAIKSTGLRVISDLSGEFNAGTQATDDPKNIGPVDLVLYTVKMFHNDDAIPFIAPLVGDNTVVLTVQNGVDNGELLAKAYGDDHVMVGMVGVQARIREPGVVEQLGQFGIAVFGDIRGGITDKGRRLYDVFKNGGWNVEISDNAMSAVWRKYLFLTGAAGVNAITQIPYSEMRTIPETRELIFQSCSEILAVGKAKGAPVDDSMLDWAMTALDNFPADGMASLAKDFKAGNRVELEGIIGTVVRMGKETGVPTLINSTIYAVLKPAAMKIEAGLF